MAVYGVPEGGDLGYGRRPVAGIPGRPSGALAIVDLARVPVSAQTDMPAEPSLPPCAAISCISLFFLQRRETRRVRPHARSRNKKTRRGMPSGFLA
jgi:hypothetical protein